jgi:hypothetical protein
MATASEAIKSHEKAGIVAKPTIPGSKVGSLQDVPGKGALFKAACQKARNASKFRGSSGGEGAEEDFNLWERSLFDYPVPFGEAVPGSILARLCGILEGAGIAFAGRQIFGVHRGVNGFCLSPVADEAGMSGLHPSLVTRPATAQGLGEVCAPVAKAARPVRRNLDMGAGHTSKVFDLVLSAWCPSVRRAPDLLKMEAYARTWCVCIAPWKVHYDPIFDKILRAFRVPSQPLPNVVDLRLALADEGRSYIYDTLKESTHTLKTGKDIAEDVLAKLASLKRQGDPALVGRMVESLWPNGDNLDRALECRTEIDSGVLIWRVDRKR